MSTAQIGAAGWDGQAQPGDRWHLSASTIGRALAAPQLERWGYRRTAEVVVDNLPMLNHLAGVNRSAAEEFVREARWAARAPGELGSADRGTALHAYIEARLLGTPHDLPTVLQHLVETRHDFRMPDLAAAMAQLAPFLPHVEGWLATYRPEPIEVEAVVYDPAHGLAGRLDFKVRLRGRFAPWPVTGPVVIVDAKSTDKALDNYGRPSKPFADSHPLQLAALAHATHRATWQPRIVGSAGGGRFYLANDDELALATSPCPVDGAMLLQITPGHCTGYPVRIGPDVHAYAVAVASAWRWAHLVSKSTIAGPLEPAEVTS